MEQHKISRKNVTYLRKHKKRTQKTLRKDLSTQMLLEKTASFSVQNQYFVLLFFGKFKTQPRKGPYTL